MDSVAHFTHIINNVTVAQFLEVHGDSHNVRDRVVMSAILVEVSNNEVRNVRQPMAVAAA